MSISKFLICIVTIFLSSCGIRSYMTAAQQNLPLSALGYSYRYCGTVKKTTAVITLSGQTLTEMKVNNNLSSLTLALEPGNASVEATVQAMTVGSYTYACVYSNSAASATIENANAVIVKEWIPATGPTVSW